MAGKRLSASEQDPDYENIDLYHAKRMRILEQDAKDATVKKISTIITNQFNQSIMDKQQEINCIHQHLRDSKGIMDKLRAYIVACYYGSTEKFPNDQGSNQPQRLHPAVKSLLGGKKPSSVLDKEMDHLSNHSASNSLDSSSNDTCMDNSSEFPPKLQEKSLGMNTSLSCNVKDNQSDSVSTDNNSESTRASRFKMSKKIIIGNVSRFIPPDKREGNDLASHKWMVYVRGPKEEPSIDHFVKKVWFFLHPSYRPNDFIEISKPPFHLTRRGWGEFPVRVQIHFHNSRNKRIDVVHMLKLDKTYTGLQTLGAETNVTVLLYKPDVFPDPQSDEALSSLSNIKSETITESGDSEEFNAEKPYLINESETKSAPSTILTPKLEPVDSKSTSIQNEEETNEDSTSVSKISVQEEIEVSCSDYKLLEIPEVKNAKINELVNSDSQNKIIERLSCSTVINKEKPSVSNFLTKHNALESKNASKTVSLIKTQKEFIENEKTIQMDTNLINKNFLNSNSINKNCFTFKNSVLESNNLLDQNDVLESASLTCKPIISDKRQSVSGVSLLRNNRLTNSLKVVKSENSTTSTSAPLASVLLLTKNTGKSLICTNPSSSSSPLPSPSLLSSIKTNKGAKNESDTSNSVLNSAKISSVFSSSQSSTSSILLVPSIPKVNSAVQLMDPSTNKQKTSIQNVIKNFPNNISSTQPSVKISQQGSITVAKTQSIPNNNYVTYIKCVNKQGNIFYVPQSALIKSTTEDASISSVNNSKSATIQVSNSFINSNFASSSTVISSETTSSQATQSSLPTYLLQVIPSTSGSTGQAQFVQLPHPVTKPSPSIYSKDRGKIIKQLIPQNSMEKVLTNQEDVSLEVDTEKSNKGPLRIKIEDCQTMKEVLSRVLKHFPLINENAVKNIHPYCASSTATYMSWCIGKRRAAEWQRARAVRLSILEAFKESERWKDNKVMTIKAILLWCRQFGYTPLKEECSSSRIEESEESAICQLNTYSDNTEFLKKLEEFKNINEKPTENSDTEEIDIEAIDEVALIKTNKSITHDEDDSKLCLYYPLSMGAEYVHEETSKMGVKLKPLEIQPGIMMPVIEEILFQISKSFADDLLRSSLSCSFKRQEGKCWSNKVLLEDVYQCIVSQPEFRFLTNDYLGKSFNSINKEKHKT